MPTPFSLTKYLLRKLVLGPLAPSSNHLPPTLQVRHIKHSQDEHDLFPPPLGAIQQSNFCSIAFQSIVGKPFCFFFFSSRFALPPLPPPSCRRRRAVALPPPPQHLRGYNRTAAVVLCSAAVLCAAAFTSTRGQHTAIP